MKFIVRVKCCYSHYIIIKEKAAWGLIKILLETDFCYRRIRWSGSPLYFVSIFCRSTSSRRKITIVHETLSLRLSVRLLFCQMVDPSVGLSLLCEYTCRNRKRPSIFDKSTAPMDQSTDRRRMLNYILMLLSPIEIIYDP